MEDRIDEALFLHLIKSVEKCVEQDGRINWERVADSVPSLEARDCRRLWRKSVYWWKQGLVVDDDASSDKEDIRKSISQLPAPSILSLLAEPSEPSRKRKRNVWSAQEDISLLSGVLEHGEGNWSIISQGSLDRTPCQLSQRWAILKSKMRQGAYDTDDAWKRFGRMPSAMTFDLVVQQNPQDGQAASMKSGQAVAASMASISPETTSNLAAQA
eukprot:CAMPEP_0177671200 /NCGR_PEP_ID=MMETSP0447-20121125/24563_1 /TAXON_ID=0 /ORGANISM="Stygamoeba regulata, Strain BSH-02190019" /LENGTH=213 /DNA_ID=CAMNT_0019178549 /DNA_START=266 /DNA_END=904 /DNA_ORIENTATION=-